MPPTSCDRRGTRRGEGPDLGRTDYGDGAGDALSAAGDGSTLAEGLSGTSEGDADGSAADGVGLGSSGEDVGVGVGVGLGDGVGLGEREGVTTCTGSTVRTVVAGSSGRTNR